MKNHPYIRNIYSRAKTLEQLHRDFWQMICDDWIDYESGYTTNNFYILMD